MTNNLVLCLRYPGCTKLNTMARNQPASQPILIVVATDWDAKRNTSAVDDQYIQQISSFVDMVRNI